MTGVDPRMPKVIFLIFDEYEFWAIAGAEFLPDLGLPSKLVMGKD